MKVKRTERGWGGHFIGASSCNFRRNTLLEYGDEKIVISTVGQYFPIGAKEPDEIGYQRYYETMAWGAKWEKPYWETDISKNISFGSKWEIDNCNTRADLQANRMHEVVVAELTQALVDDNVCIADWSIDG